METKKRKKRVRLCIILISITIICIFLVVPSFYEQHCKNKIYSDMEASVDTIESANIRIVNGYQSGGAIIYNPQFAASGVVFAHENEMYYALTAYHVVDDAAGSQILTTFTASSSDAENVKKYGPEYIKNATVEYYNEKLDLAIISFQFPEKLNVAEIAADNPEKGDRIVAIGNPFSAIEPFIRSYGEILSSKVISAKEMGGTSEKPLLKHNAYMEDGNSGGAVFSEEMKLVGINIASANDILGRFRYGAMVPCSRITEFIREWREGK